MRGLLQITSTFVSLFLLAASPVSLATNSCGDPDDLHRSTAAHRPDSIRADGLLVKLTFEAAEAAASLPEDRLPTGVPGLERFRLRHGIASGRRVVAEHGLPIADPALFDRTGLNRWYLLALPQTGAGRILHMVRELRGQPWVEYAEPIRALQFTATPNDPLYPDQWHHDNTGQSGGTVDADIDSPEAWDTTIGDPGAVVAVLDYGANLTHEDLVDNLIAGWDFVDDDDTPEDTHGHGTAMSGCAAARGDNGVGVAGVCWNCAIMPLKIQLQGGTYVDTVVDAIRYAADNGADVMNMSFGSPGWTQAISDAVDYAHDRGVVAVAGTGNSDRPYMLVPAAIPRVIAVGGADDDDVRIYCYGDHLDVTAPAENLWSTHFEGGYAETGGTSGATALTSGLATLLRAGDPDLHVNEIRHLLRLGADDQVGEPSEDSPGWDRYMGFGRINANGAMSLVDGPWLALDRPHYVCAGELTVALKDKAAGTTVDVTLSGDIGGDTETVTVSAVTVHGYFEGSIPLSWAGKDGPVTPGNGALDVVHGETVTASVDSLSATAFLECIKKICHRPEFVRRVSGDCDDDGAADPGEVWSLYLKLYNEHQEMLHGTTATLEAVSADVEVLTGTATYGGVITQRGFAYPDDDGSDDPFRIRVLAGAPADGTATLRVTSIEGDGWEWDEAGCIAGGHDQQFGIPSNRDPGSDSSLWDFDDGTAQGFTNALAHGTGDLSECNYPPFWYDDWGSSPVSDRSHSGAYAMRLGDGVSYRSSIDGGLSTPLFAVPAGGGALGFHVWIDAEAGYWPQRTVDGLVVEARRPAEPLWTYIEEGDYNANQYYGTCDTVHAIPFGWAENTAMIGGDGDGDQIDGDDFGRKRWISLDSYAGETIQARIRFGSDSYPDSEGVGTWIDTVSVFQWVADGWPGDAPANLQGSDTSCPASYDLAWDAVPGAEGYNIYRSESSCDDASGRPDIYGTSTTPDFSDTGLTPNVDYFYAVEARESGSGCPTMRSCIPGGCICDLPEDPVGLRVDKSDDDVLLAWNDPGITGMTWNVYRDAEPDPSLWGAPHHSGVTDEDPGTAGIQYTDAGAISAGSVLHYLVTAVDECGESPLR